MATYTYQDGGGTSQLFRFIDNPGLISAILGGTSDAVVTDGLFDNTFVTGTGLTWSGITPTGGVVTALRHELSGFSLVTLTDISLEFSNFTLGTYVMALDEIASVHTDLAGDTTANQMLGGREGDSFYSRDGEDTLVGNPGADSFFVTERVGGVRSPGSIEGGLDEDQIFIVNLAGQADAYVNLASSLLAGVELLNLLQGGQAALTAAQAAGLAVDMAASTRLEVLQADGQALNLNTLFASLTRAGGSVWLVGNGSGAADVQIGRTGVNNALYGGNGRDRLTGATLRDELYGGGSHDVLTGNGGRDLLFGGAGNDTLVGGADQDAMTGGAGNDTYRVSGFELVSEAQGEGTDWIESFQAITLEITANVENARLLGSGNLRLTGSDGANVLQGNAGANVIGGLRGNDRISGGGGADRIAGDAGNDILAGQAGNDTLAGGQGSDVFVFATGSGRDRVEGMVSTGPNADRIDLRDLAAVTGFADLRQNHMRQAGANVEIHAGTDVLVLAGKTLGQFDAADFLF